MSEEPRIRQVHQLDQSLWLDSLSRRLLVSGDLDRLRDRGVTGITSNPTIFRKAIACLWASTSVKDPRYPETMYVDNLIGPETIDTLPAQTLEVFVDHGAVRNALEADLERARHDLDELARLGLDLARVTAELEDEGVSAFHRSYEELLSVVTETAAATASSRTTS